MLYVCERIVRRGEAMNFYFTKNNLEKTFQKYFLKI